MVLSALSTAAWSVAAPGAIAAFAAASSVAAQQVDFAWGFGGSAYQFEGAWNVDGKGESVFDRWSRTNPERIGQPNGDRSADHYNRVKSDLAYLGQLGATAYRFSISWPRILPNCTGTVNERGVQFYSDMIDEILRQGAEPFLTMYHWDLPQACLDQGRGFTNSSIIDAFVEYADVLFDRFGGRVKYWLTVNEPQANCNFGYRIGVFAPGLRLGDQSRFDCMHYTHILHGRVYQLAKTKYASKGSKDWQFGLPSIIEWYEPDGSDPALSGDAGWYYAPCVEGDYDAASRSRYGNALPTFTEEEKNIMRGSCDYLALNYYSGVNIQPTIPSGKSWQTVYPPGARKLANWFYNRFKIDIIYTEIGYTAPGEKDWTREQVINDSGPGYRSRFWNETVTQIMLAAEVDKTPIKGMLAWALIDNFEWLQYDDKFGCIGVDFQNGTLDRYVKRSTQEMANFFRRYKSPFARTSPTTPGGTTGTTGTTTVTTTGSNKSSADKAVVAGGAVTSFFAGLAALLAL